jgi:predicted DNA binding CopG/RHH family protein
MVTKYDNAVCSFAEDLKLALQGDIPLSELDEMIQKKDTQLLKDIELLQELAFLIRSKKASVNISVCFDDLEEIIVKYGIETVAKELMRCEDLIKELGNNGYDQIIKGADNVSK